MNYIALGVIAEIDNYYAGTQNHDIVKKKIEEIELPVNEEELKRHHHHSEWTLLSTWVYKVFMRTFYQSYYFYFMPLTVIAVSYFFQVSS